MPLGLIVHIRQNYGSMRRGGEEQAAGSAESGVDEAEISTTAQSEGK